MATATSRTSPDEGAAPDITLGHGAFVAHTIITSDPALARSPTTAGSLAPWLRCPTCGLPLAAFAQLVLGCTNGHRYDANKRGYVSLVDTSRKIHGDTAAMLDARTEVLEAGTYAPIADAITKLAQDASTLADRATGVAPPRQMGGRRVIDAGCGTGYYLHQLIDSSPTILNGLAIDLSPTAVARAVRGRTDIAGLVADTWRPLPVRDSVADILINVFAPRNLEEFARVLADDGTLIVVVPRPDHLKELREHGRMLDIPADKSAELVAGAEPLFDLRESRHVRFAVNLDNDLSEKLTIMGPAGHHARLPEPPGHEHLPGNANSFSVPSRTTISVDVLAFTARRTAT
jgi:23S rRNA (guanine745-N1)-methyltransferase